MGRLSVMGVISLDGYMNDAEGNFDWAEPSDEEHLFVNNLQRGASTYIYGRRLYETMRGWQDIEPDDESVVMGDYGTIWRGAEKIVVSTTLSEVTTPRTTLRRDLDLAWLTGLKETTSGDITIGGPTLAAYGIRAGLVDDLHVFLNPIMVGGGTRWLPDGVTQQLEQTDTHRFDNGVVYVAYTTRNGAIQ